VEISYISLVSYFEAFCKDHAGSLINIAPTLLTRLRDSGFPTQIEAHRAIELGSLFPTKVGFLVLENIDLGNAKKINSIFNLLLKITPFSTKDASTYNNILRDRNLLVHHGSVYTAKYLEQARPQDREPYHVYWHSLIVKPQMLVSAMHFFRDIAWKLAQSSQTALTSYLVSEGLTLRPEYQKALDFLTADIENFPDILPPPE
jgi:hypothetical protein